jgi:hypothetical protein
MAWRWKADFFPWTSVAQVAATLDWDADVSNKPTIGTSTFDPSTQTVTTDTASREASRATGFATPTNVTDARDAVIAQGDAEWKTATGFAEAGDEMTLTEAYDAAKTAAPASTALDKTVWTDEKAGFLDAKVSEAGGGTSAEAMYTYFIADNRADVFKANVAGLATTANQNIIIAHLTDIKGAGWTDQNLVQIAADAATAAGATGGQGARTITITVTDGTDPLEGARIRMKKGAEDYVVTTNASGQVEVGRDDGTWNVAITLPNYTFEPTTLVVSATTEDVEYEMELVAISPPDSPLNCNCGWVCLDSSDNPVAGVVIRARPDTDSAGTGYAWSGQTRAATSVVGTGLALISLPQGSKWWIRRDSGAEELFTVPATSTTTTVVSVRGGKRDAY